MTTSVPRPWSVPHWSMWLLLVVAAAVRIAQLDIPPHVDELYHFLSAQSWLREGSLAIGDGEYTRTPAFTVMVARSLQLFGESLSAARVPALVFGLAWIAFVFVWMEQAVGLAAAWIGGLLFALDPGAINLAQFTRFYTLQGVLFWLGATGLFWVVTERSAWQRRAAYLALACLCLTLAVYFQEATAIGLAALGVWIAVETGVTLRLGGRAPMSKRALLLVALGVLLVGALALGAGLLEDPWQRYRTAAAWAEPWADQWRFYHWWLEDRYPVLWSLFPLAALLAVARHRRVAVFLLTLFVVPLLLHSFAAQKHERYLYYAVPFFFVLWGLVLGHLLPALADAARRAWEKLTAIESAGLLNTGVPLVLVGAAVGFAAYTNPAFKMTVDMMRQDGYQRPYGHPNWRDAEPVLDSLARGRDVVLASRAIKALHFVGRADADLLAVPSQTSTLRQEGPYRVDVRIGRPVISDEQTLLQFLECYRSGLVVVETGLWRTPMGVSRPLARIMERGTRKVDVPQAWGLVVRVWSDDSHAEADSPMVECGSLRRLVGVSPPSGGA